MLTWIIIIICFLIVSFIVGIERFLVAQNKILKDTWNYVKVLIEQRRKLAQSLLQHIKSSDHTQLNDLLKQSQETHQFRDQNIIEEKLTRVLAKCLTQYDKNDDLKNNILTIQTKFKDAIDSYNSVVRNYNGLLKIFIFQPIVKLFHFKLAKFFILKSPNLQRSLGQKI